MPGEILPCSPVIRHRVAGAGGREEIDDRIGAAVKLDWAQCANTDKLHWRYVHEVVNKTESYLRGRVHVNGMENFWSLLKRGLSRLSGTYVAVEPFHLFRYVDEQVFRYNNRATKDNPLNDADRFSLLCSQIVGKRLTYAELTAKEDKQPGPVF